MTFLGPLLIAGMYGLAIWFALNSDDLNQIKKVYVVDESGFFADKLENSKTIEFIKSNEKLGIAKDQVRKNEDSYLLSIPPAGEKDPSGISLFSEKQPSLNVVNYIEKSLSEIVKDQKLIDNGIDKKVLGNIKTEININTFRLTDKGVENGSAGASFGVGFIAALMIYMFIFLYGIQVMRGVIEEKNNRIVEVVISSVRPFQLMMGKILGIALVGLTQFLLWVVLTFAISGFVGSKFGLEKMKDIQQTELSKSGNSGQQNMSFKKDGVKEFLSAANTINFPLILGCFLFYFIGGYLLYSALFAAIGSAVDNETETQQFMLPVTIPLIFSFIVSSSAIVNAPDSPLAFWLSIIPLTSPVVMMVRIPFGVPFWQLGLSMLTLVLGFIGTVWMAAKIYRTGILLYGKKVNFREIGKWLFYKG